MSNAGYGLMMGLGKGLAETGGMFAREAMTRASDERQFNRQKSLEEIRQRYQEQVKADDRAYELKKITPGNPTYDAFEQERQKSRKEKLEDEKALIEARGQAYGYGASSGGGIYSKFNPDLYTPESAQEFIAKVEELMASDPELADDPQRLYQRARALFGDVLVPKKTTGSTSAGVNDIQAEINLFAGYDIDTQREQVVLGGLPQEEADKLSRQELVEAFMEQQIKRYQRIQGALGGGGLMNGQPGQGAGQPGQDADAGQQYQTPTPRAIEALKADPSPDKIRQYNELFGPGAAERALGQG